MRIGILTFHRAYNCGAMLQAWALKKTLERMGHVAEFPACNHVGEDAKRFRFVEWHNREKKGLQWIRSVVGRAFINIRSLLYNLGSIPSEDILRLRYKVFRKKFLPERCCTPSSFDNLYDLLVFGSDQIWHPKIADDSVPLFLREVGDSKVRAISYAASYGDKPLDGKVLDRVVSALERFDKISVRERLAKDQLLSMSNKEITEVLDPTLLLQASDYDEIADGKVPNEPYLFLYMVAMDSAFMDIAKSLAKRLGVKCIIAPCYQYSRWKAPKGLTYSVSPDRMVQYARNAKYVLASSFHGTVMGVIFNKPLLSLRAQVDQYESRPASLLRKLGMTNRLVNPTTSLDEMERLLREPLPDYSVALERECAASLDWLKKAIGE